MTTSESKGRFFFTKRIDSHNESNRIYSNRELECSSTDARDDHRHAVYVLWALNVGLAVNSDWYRPVWGCGSRNVRQLTFAVSSSLVHNKWIEPWASAHRGKWGQLTPWINGWKIKKRNHAKKAVFSVYVIFWEQSGQVGVDNGAMLTIYLFR